MGEPMGVGHCGSWVAGWISPLIGMDELMGARVR